MFSKFQPFSLKISKNGWNFENRAKLISDSNSAPQNWSRTILWRPYHTSVMFSKFQPFFSKNCQNWLKFWQSYKSNIRFELSAAKLLQCNFAESWSLVLTFLKISAIFLQKISPNQPVRVTFWDWLTSPSHSLYNFCESKSTLCVDVNFCD